MTPLVNLGFEPVSYTPGIEPNTHGTKGINEKGQCVYGYKPSTNLTAWVWLPEYDNDYSMSAGFHVLGSGQQNQSIARDLNHHGIVVGSAGTYLQGTPRFGN